MSSQFRNILVVSGLFLFCLGAYFIYHRESESTVSQHNVAGSNKGFVEVKRDFDCDESLMPKLLEAKKLTREGDLHNAERLRREVAEENPTCTDAWIELALSLYLLEEFEKAEEIYLNMHEKFPNDKWIILSIAIVSSDLNKRTTSIDYYVQALEIDGSFARAHFGIAEEYYKSGDHNQSVYHYKRFLEIDPKSNKATNAKKMLERIETENL